MKRFLAVVMAVVFTVTGITFTPKEAKADVDYTFGTTLNDISSTQQVSFGKNGKWRFSAPQYAEGDLIHYGVTTDNSAIIYYESMAANNQDNLYYYPDIDSETTYNFTITAECAAAPSANNTVFYPTWTNTSSTFDNNVREIRPYNKTGNKHTISGTITTSSNTPRLDLNLGYWGNYGLQNDNNSVKITVNLDPVENDESQVTTTAEPEETTDAQGYYAATVDGDWHTVPTNGFQYKLNAGMTGSKYKGGTSISDPFDISIGTYVGASHDFQTKSPVLSVTAGHTYRLTYNIDNVGPNNAANIYAVVTNANGDVDITSNYDNQISINSGADQDIVLEYTAPASGQVYFKVNISWTARTEFLLQLMKI